MTEHDELTRAFERAYRALGTRDRTQSELRSFLERKLTAPEVIDTVIEELVAIGAIDDARYATHFTEDRRRLDAWGSERIAGDLARRGVEQELIEAALAVTGPEDELAAAIDLLDRRFQEPFASDKDRDRAWRLLVRRGYAPELAYSAVRSHERGQPGHQGASGDLTSL